MSAKQLSNYLRTFRKRSGLSQKEVAILLGSLCGSKVSHYESAKRIPNLETVFAYEVIFSVPASQLFSGIFHEVKNEVENQAIRLLHNWKTVPVPEHKTVLIHSIFKNTDYLLEKLKSFDVHES